MVFHTNSFLPWKAKVRENRSGAEGIRRIGPQIARAAIRMPVFRRDSGFSGGLPATMPGPDMLSGGRNG
jgi:hypothetical protein